MESVVKFEFEYIGTNTTSLLQGSLFHQTTECFHLEFQIQYPNVTVWQNSEVFERNLGMSTPLKIARGANQLYRDGGLFYIPPIK